MTYLKYYQEEDNHFPKEWKDKLTEETIIWFFQKFRNQYKFKHSLKIWGNYGGRCFSYYLRVCKNCSIGLLIHEIGHSIQFKKDHYRYIKGKRYHSNQHLKIMKRLFKFYLKNKDKWNKQLQRRTKPLSNRYEA